MTGHEPGFEVTRRGYRTAQVDAWVDEVHRVVAALEDERDDARRLAASLQASVDELRARENVPDTFGARAERILRMAEHEAHLRRERAESDAAEIRELAHSEAERTVAQARREAAHLRAEAERARGDAEQDAARARSALADARRDAELRADTAASMNEHVQSLRSAVRGELARLHAALGAELRVLEAPVTPVVPEQAPPAGADADVAAVPPVPVPPVPVPVPTPAVAAPAVPAESVSAPSVPAASVPAVPAPGPDAPAGITAAGTAVTGTGADRTDPVATGPVATGPVPTDLPGTSADERGGPVRSAAEHQGTPPTGHDVPTDRHPPVVVTLPVQRDRPATGDTTPAIGTPAATPAAERS